MRLSELLDSKKFGGESFGGGDGVSVKFGGEFWLTVVAAAIEHRHGDTIFNERS